MKISLNWLQRYIDLSGRSPQAIEQALTMIGFEVESIETLGLPDLENCVVGEILERVDHPNADRLGVCKVSTGTMDTHSIVCGASNYKVGDRVPVALPGCLLPGGFKIKKTKLRGVPSEGMLCSARELGLGDDHAGLLILEQRPEPGTPLNQVFPDRETVFDIEVTPNRPDCLSHIGIARELAAYWDLDLEYPALSVNPRGPFAEDSSPLVQKLTSETDFCPFYQGWNLQGITIAPSPEWLQKDLRAIGLRPINNVVDVTNFVLHELGQPLHAFDAGKIKSKEICVRMATQGERITTLDGKERSLQDQMMVIADAGRALVIAGVMGSLEAEVDDHTTSIFLESAYFRASNIRRTSRQLGLSTDSSYRFERGVDPCGAEFAALRAIDLILETAGGKLCGPPLTIGEPPAIEQEIAVTRNFVEQKLGFSITDEAIERSLANLGFSVNSEETFSEENGIAVPDTLFSVSIPSFRLDLGRPCDLVEEILRIYGTDKIPASPVSTFGSMRQDDPLTRFQRNAASLLAAKGFMECVTTSMRSEKEIRQWYGHADADNLGMANPLASDQSHLRPSLLPGLLDALQLNKSRSVSLQGLFEIGRAFREVDGKVWETLFVGVVLPKDPETSWDNSANRSFFTMSALAQDLLRLAGIKEKPENFLPLEDDEAWQKGHSASAGAFSTGWEIKFGLLSFPLLRHWDLEEGVLACGLYFLPDFLRQTFERPRYKSLSSFPPASRDLALVVDANRPAGPLKFDIEKTARNIVGSAFEVEEVRIFDVYSGKGIPDGTKSLAFSLRFRSQERNLTDEEVNQAFLQIQKALIKPGISLR